MTLVRIVLWSLGDAQASVDELREQLPLLEPPSAWIWNEPAERFGGLIVGDEARIEALAEARALIGKEPDAYEEFDAD